MAPWARLVPCLTLCGLLLAAVGATGQAPLPEDAAAVCNRATLFEATSQEHSCSETLYHRDDAVEPCCRVLAEYYGPNSTRPSRNCFCVEGYWSAFVALSDFHYISWTNYFDQCSDMGYPVHYFQDGEGPCAPLPPAQAPAPAPSVEVLAPAPAEEAAGEQEPPAVLPMRSFGAWVAGLGQDSWGLASFVMACVAALGSNVMAWTFIFDACADLKCCCAGLQRRTAAAAA